MTSAKSSRPSQPALRRARIDVIESRAAPEGRYRTHALATGCPPMQIRPS